MVLTVSAMSTVRKTALRLLLPAAFIFWLPAPAAEVLIVDQNGGGDFTGIQSALDAAQDGDTVLVMPGCTGESASTGCFDEAIRKVLC